MDSVFEKFSVFDFFNLVFSGAIFLIGIQFLGIRVFNLISLLCSIDFTKVNSLEKVLYFTIVLCVCYVIGSCIQEVGSLFQNKCFDVQDKAISNLLNDYEVVGNRQKHKVYVDKAKKLFESKDITIYDNCFSEDQCKYFFAYCVYYIQVRDYNKKTEKMRDVHGISNMLSTSFAILFIFGSLTILINTIFGAELLFEYTPSIKSIILLVIYAVLAVLFWFKMKKNILYRIRMVLGVFDASTDKE